MCRGSKGRLCLREVVNSSNPTPHKDSLFSNSSCCTWQKHVVSILLLCASLKFYHLSIFIHSFISLFWILFLFCTHKVHKRVCMFANCIDVFVCLFGNFLLRVHFILVSFSLTVSIIYAMDLDCFPAIPLSFPLPSHSGTRLSNIYFSWDRVVCLASNFWCSCLGFTSARNTEMYHPSKFFHWFRIVFCVFAYTCMHTSDTGVHVCVCISSTYTMTPFSNQDVVIQSVVCTHLINIARIC